MAKKAAPRKWINEVELAIRAALSRITGLDDLPEEQYCDVVLDGLDLVKTGVEMRQQELQSEE